MSDFLHGVETLEKNEINMTISGVDISSVVIIGTAPTYLLEHNEVLPKITNFTESKTYVGNNIDGFTLPDAVETVLTESDGADIYTINIFDNEKHTSTINKSITFIDDKCILTETGIQNLVLTQNSEELELNTDYEFDGNTITIIESGTIAENRDNITASYKYVDFSKISDADVIGEVDREGKRTGLQKIYDIIATYGIQPGIIIAPGFTSKIVRTAIETIAEKIRGFAYLDAPQSTNIPLAEKARLKETENVDLTSQSEYSQIGLTWVNRYNSYLDKISLKPISPVLAGLRVRLDRERNIAKSIDNTLSRTILKTEFPVYFALNEKGTDSNRVNALGLSTVINYRGAYYIWGGRNSSYPNKTGIMTFEAARRTRNYIQKSIEDSSFICVGENITRGFIDDVLNAINSFFAKHSNPTDSTNFIMYGGEAYYDESLNTAEDLANGHIKFAFKWCPLCTAERITYQDVLDITIITKALAA